MGKGLLVVHITTAFWYNWTTHLWLLKEQNSKGKYANIDKDSFVFW